MAKTYGYIRVSSTDQNEARQLNELTDFGIDRKDIFMDKQSGKDFDRPAYKRLRKKLKAGDIVVLTSLDRLGRNYKDVIDEWRYISKERGADIVILDMPILDTRRDKDLIGTLITDIVLQLLSYVAQVERENIRSRQAEGIAAARLAGVHLGRYPLPLPEGFGSIYNAWESKEITPTEAMNIAQMTPGQFYWNVTKYRRYLDEKKRED